MSNNLKKGLVSIFLANIINLIFNILTNFLLPKYLSIDSYAAIKTFQLYTTYIGVFSLGIADGMYLRYGGKSTLQIDQNELSKETFSFRLIMIFETLILVPIAIIYKDKIIITFVFTILSMNMTNYFKNLYQAIGEFKKYGRILNLTTILTFIVNMGLLFLLKIDNYFYYLICYAIVDGIIWMLLEKNIHLFNVQHKNEFSIKIIVDDIKSGFLLMVGNFSNILLSSMDRWFVKMMMSSSQFAFYSFAVSLEGFLNVAITPITTTLYNYFCNHMDYDDILNTRKNVMIFGSIIIAAAFPAKFIIEVFLTNYKGAVDVLFILFATQMIYVVIKGVYINLYKAKKMQNKYFYRLVFILIVGFVLNFTLVKIYPYKESFAYGTLLSAIIWLVICIYDFKSYIFSIREWIYLILEIVIFIILGEYCNSITGLLLYIAVTLCMLVVFMNNEVKGFIKSFMNKM